MQKRIPLKKVGLDVESLWWEDKGSCPWLRLILCVSWGTGPKDMRTIVAEVPGVFAEEDLEELYEVVTEPGVVIVGHNVRRYDLDVVQGLLGRRLPAIRHQDTMNDIKMGRVERNTLRARCEKYGINLKSESPDWRKIIQMDEAEWERMVEYCENDVVCALELERALAEDGIPVPMKLWKGKRAA